MLGVASLSIGFTVSKPFALAYFFVIGLCYLTIALIFGKNESHGGDKNK